MRVPATAAGVSPKVKESNYLGNDTRNIIRRKSFSRMLFSFFNAFHKITEINTLIIHQQVDNTGGSNGSCMRMAPEKDWDANAGLHVARDFMEGGLALHSNQLQALQRLQLFRFTADSTVSAVTTRDMHNSKSDFAQADITRKSLNL